MRSHTNENSSSYTLRVGDHMLVASALNQGTPGSAIVLLHGITASNAAWDSGQARSWLEYGPCYALSLPGHYPASFLRRSTRDKISASELAETLAAGIRALVGDTPVTLVGHSTGAFAALAVAAVAPAQVARVVSIAGFARGRWTGILGHNQRLAQAGPVGRALVRTLYALCRQRYALYKASLRFYVHDHRRFYATPGLDAYLRASFPNFQRLDLHAVTHYFRHMPAIDISPWLARIRVPVLLVAGLDDPIVPAQESSRMATLLPDASLRLIAACGHVPFLEQPVIFRDVVDAWLVATTPVIET